MDNTYIELVKVFVALFGAVVTYYVIPYIKAKTTKEQREALKRDSSLMFDVNYGAISIDKLLNKPNATYNTISGSDLTKRASDMASNFAKTIQSNPQYKSILGGQYFQQMQQMGYTPQQVMQTIMNDPNAPKELKQIADTVWKEFGLDNWLSVRIS